MRRVALFAEDRLGIDETTALVVADWPVVIVRTAEGYHALLDRCSHVGAPLSDGRLRRGTLQCARHGASFDLASGRCLHGPYPPVPTFPVTVENGSIMIDLPDRAPTVDELPVP